MEKSTTKQQTQTQRITQAEERLKFMCKKDAQMLLEKLRKEKQCSASQLALACNLSLSRVCVLIDRLAAFQMIAQVETGYYRLNHHKFLRVFFLSHRINQSVPATV